MKQVSFNPRYIDFYKNFFDNEERAHSLLSKCYLLSETYIDDEELVKPRRIVNNIARLLGIADELRANRHGGYGLQIHFWMICIEAIVNIATPSRRKKIAIVRQFFIEFIPDEDQQFLLRHFTRLITDERWFNSPQLDISIIASIFYAIRNDVVHDGEYSDFHFSDSNDNPTQNILKLREFDNDSFEPRHYHVTVTYEQMRTIMIRACLYFLSERIKLSEEYINKLR
ncbi:MAG: hypothetical protein WDZ91_02380 [Paenibacillaceae bacterium]